MGTDARHPSILCRDHDEIIRESAEMGGPPDIARIVADTRMLLDDGWLEKAEIDAFLIKASQELMLYATLHGMDLMKLSDTLNGMVHECCVAEAAEGDAG